jgi:hypothetical protein
LCANCSPPAERRELEREWPQPEPAGAEALPGEPLLPVLDAPE